jgi:lipoyl(octanoyl) transferase
MDLSPFGRINPCGYAGMKMVQSKDLGGPLTMAVAKAQISSQFVSQLAVTELITKTGFYD